jgi:hypothetical protein
MLGQSDRHLMEFCIEEMSTVITKNREHFEELHRSVVPERPEDVYHAGIIIAPNVTTPELEVALNSFLEATDPNSLINELRYLPIPPESPDTKDPHWHRSLRDHRNRGRGR